MSELAAATAARGRATLSLVVTARDEETNLPRCLASLAGLADQIVVVDSGSVDRTVEIARAAGAEVVVREFSGYIAQSRAAWELARGDWILALDADEWLAPELRVSIEQALAGRRREIDGWQVERRAFVLGSWVRHGGWAEWKLRFSDIGSHRKRCTSGWTLDRLTSMQ